MNRTILAALLLPFACLAGTAAAQEIELASLGALELVFQPAQAVQRYPGRPVAATVGFRRGEALNVPSPGRLQQIEYLVEPGAAVDKGQPFAVLRGPEMHHFEMNYDSSRELLASAERRFRANRALYERKAISESRWLEISEQYYALALEHEHMRHFFELVKEGDNDPDSLTLVAPVSGMIDYLPAQGVVQEGDNIAQFLPLGVIRLQAALPIAIRNQVAALQAGSCTLPVARVEAVTDGFLCRPGVRRSPRIATCCWARSCWQRRCCSWRGAGACRSPLYSSGNARPTCCCAVVSACNRWRSSCWVPRGRTTWWPVRSTSVPAKCWCRRSAPCRAFCWGWEASRCCTGSFAFPLPSACSSGSSPWR